MCIRVFRAPACNRYLHVASLLERHKQSNLGSRGCSSEHERGFIGHNTEVWDNSSLSYFHEDRTKLIVLFLAKEISVVLIWNKKVAATFSCIGTTTNKATLLTIFLFGCFVFGRSGYCLVLMVAHFPAVSFSFNCLSEDPCLLFKLLVRLRNVLKPCDFRSSLLNIKGGLSPAL